jgi:hypothetical protein
VRFEEYTSAPATETEEMDLNSQVEEDEEDEEGKRKDVEMIMNSQNEEPQTENDVSRFFALSHNPITAFFQRLHYQGNILRQSTSICKGINLRTRE